MIIANRIMAQRFFFHSKFNQNCNLIFGSDISFIAEK